MTLLRLDAEDATFSYCASLEELDVSYPRTSFIFC
ncbi:MAG: hypothetical protein KHY45_05260 [Eubacterium sp.]|nr:hypothetical protein [Eubacterium sp.]MBP7427295.1 hypothetical protein [Lachnospira sp.]MBP8713730.1 hypothetical protein [Lachnospira sp.]MBS5268717.1 hypothetical protein [Eubacterium sp.]HAS71907.1 hypothetical protein [Eubacterium sp.]